MEQPNLTPLPVARQPLQRLGGGDPLGLLRLAVLGVLAILGVLAVLGVLILDGLEGPAAQKQLAPGTGAVGGSEKAQLLGKGRAKTSLNIS